MSFIKFFAEKESDNALNPIVKKIVIEEKYL
jgi:hypothetical protein